MSCTSTTIVYHVEEDDALEDEEDMFLLATCAQTAHTLVLLHNQVKSGSKLGCSIIPRQRIPVHSIFARLGHHFFRRCYRMSESLFWILHSLLQPTMKIPPPRKRGKTPNGDIHSSARLSMALRWFAGGDPLDIFQVHGVHYQEVYNSLWIVVDAINSCPELQIKFPTNHQTQLEIASGFQKISRAGFDNCVGCIDCMLIWVNKPCKKSKELVAGIGPKKYFCGRKKKFGIVLQAICDHKRRFLDIDIRHPGSTSDYLAFVTSHIHKELLSNQALLHPDLTLFGDSAYVNAPFMATPFKGTNSGIKDAYNFYHSQVRISIECTFGMLVHRFGCLRKPMPVNITMDKVVSLVRCLCVLHNFCIDGNESYASPATASDSRHGVLAGGFEHTEAESRPEQLLDGGHHMNDVGNTNARQLYRQGQQTNNYDNTTEQEQQVVVLPREKMVTHLQDRGMDRRPAPIGSTTTNN